MGHFKRKQLLSLMAKPHCWDPAHGRNEGLLLARGLGVTSALGPMKMSPSRAPAMTRTCLGLPTLQKRVGRTVTFILSFLKDLTYLFLERGEGREKEGERNIDVREKYQSVAPHTPPTRDLARNPGMCPDWESNQQTGNPSVRRPELSPLSHTTQGRTVTFHFTAEHPAEHRKDVWRHILRQEEVCSILL